MILVYDVTDERTFQNVEEWMRCIAENTQECQIIQKVLCANKMDLSLDLHRVSSDTGRQLAEKHGIDYFEVSAKEGHGINEAFMHLSQLVYKAQEKSSIMASTINHEDVVVLHDIPVHSKKQKQCCGKSKNQ